MPKLSSNQLFILALVALAILAAAAYLDRSWMPVVMSVVLSILAAAGLQHASASGADHVVTGINLGVPLQPPATPLSATLETLQTAPAVASPAQPAAPEPQIVDAAA